MPKTVGSNPEDHGDFLTDLSMSLAVKLGSLVVHCQEGIDTGHPFDAAAVKALADDAEVSAWLASFSPGLLPEKRTGSDIDGGQP